LGKLKQRHSSQGKISKFGEVRTALFKFGQTRIASFNLLQQLQSNVCKLKASSFHLQTFCHILFARPKICTSHQSHKHTFSARTCEAWPTQQVGSKAQAETTSVLAKKRYKVDQGRMQSLPTS